MVLDHVAILTDSIERFCEANGLRSGEPIDVFPDIGSREQYIDGEDVGGRLLLIQPHGDGPYQRALAKRGPGLHHLGVAVSDLASGLAEWTARGWQVHPGSDAVFLFQRGVPTLIELFVGRTDLGLPAVEVVLAAGVGVLPVFVGVRAASTSAVTHRGRALLL